MVLDDGEYQKPACDAKRQARNINNSGGSRASDISDGDLKIIE
jgi:hypothetical protein